MDHGVYQSTLATPKIWQPAIATGTLWPLVPIPYILLLKWTQWHPCIYRAESHWCAVASLSLSYPNQIINVCLLMGHLCAKPLSMSLLWVCTLFACFLPTSLWLPPVFSSCRFSPAGMSYFSHSWRGPSSALPGHCRLSAHSPQHTGKNGEFPPLWSSSFFKCFHSILIRTYRKC